jgi:Protein of unknown function (DUF2855)
MPISLDVDRNDLRSVRVHETVTAPLSQGEARLRIDSFALTSNNITYAVFGDAMKYWNFFPVPAEDGVAWGRVPVWGFAEVAESTVVGLPAATRVYGYFPMASELVVTPGRIDERGFTDVADHRSAMAATYNRYQFVDSDPNYDVAFEPHQMVLWPLFYTSFVIDDLLGESDMFGSAQVIVSSASSKTAIGSAFLLARRPGIEVVGLTSRGNKAFVESLGCYHRVVGYDAVYDMALGAAAFVDIAGDQAVTASVHERFGNDLAYSMVVGSTHWDAARSAAAAPLPGPTPQFLFAPTQIAKRSKDWGRDGLEQRVGGAWHEYRMWASGWLDFRESNGPTVVSRTFGDLVEGNVDPRIGHVCAMEPKVIASGQS